MIRVGHIRFIMLLISIFSVMLLYHFYHDYRQSKQYNQQLIKLSKDEFVTKDELNLSQPRSHFAYAHHLKKFGLYEKALISYGLAEQDDDTIINSNIQYNIGNLYLEQAIELAYQGKIDRSVALADVAKSYYQNALTHNPKFWNAKYNYEAAQRLSRDLPLGKAREIPDSTEGSKELWSAMPGFPVGLP